MNGEVSALPIELVPGVTLDMAAAFHAAAAAIAVMLAAGAISFRLRKIPGRTQTAAEMLVQGLTWLIARAAGSASARRYLPLVGTVFLFLLSYHLQGALRFDALTWGRFPRSGLEIGGERLIVDLDGNGRADPGDTFDDRNHNGHHDRGLLIPHPSMAVWNTGVDLAVAFVLLAGVILEAVRRRRMLAFLYQMITFEWISVLRGLMRAVCARWAVPHSWVLASGLLLILLTALGSIYREPLAYTGLNIPLAFVTGLTWGGGVAVLGMAFLGCATGEGQWAGVSEPHGRAAPQQPLKAST